jgi:RNA polymerase sigma-70 factor (ECF subfamily)
MEQELLRRVRKKDPKAYEELVERMEKPLMNFIYRFVLDKDTAEDIFQETFLRVVKSIHRFKPKPSLSSWIFKIARNLCIDHLRKLKRHPQVSFDAYQEDEEGKLLYFSNAILTYDKTPAEEARVKEERRLLHQAISRLSPQKREALILRVFLDMPYSDIAKIVSTPVGTIKYRVHEAMVELSKLLREKDEREVSQM